MKQIELNNEKIKLNKEINMLRNYRIKLEYQIMN